MKKVRYLISSSVSQEVKVYYSLLLHSCKKQNTLGVKWFRAAYFLDLDAWLVAIYTSMCKAVVRVVIGPLHVRPLEFNF